MSITIPIRAESGASRPRLATGSALTSLPPLSLYVHVPWCVRKCPYCDFNSHAAPGEGIPERAYLDALRSDLEQALPGIWGRQVVSVFIGGGTPSLLSAAGLDELLAMLRACLNLWPDAEITMEANPGTAEASRFRDYAASGVTRFRWASRASMTSSSRSWAASTTPPRPAPRSRWRSAPCRASTWI